MTQTHPQPLSTPKPRQREADAVLSAAHRVDAQLDRLSAWKHQLSRQMELLRRDGIKLLERQKTAAREKADLAAAHASLAADRESLAASRQDLAAQARDLDTRAAALAAAEADLTELDARKSDLESQLADAQAALDTQRTAAEIAAQAVADEHRTLAETRAQLHTAGAELQQTSTNLDSLRTQADTLAADLARAAERRDALQAELAALESAGRAANDALAEAQKALDDAQSQHARILQQAREAARNTADLTELDARTRALDDRAAHLGALAADLDARNASLDGRAAELETRLTDLHRLAAELDHRQSAITDHEAAWLARDVALRDAAEQLETQRRELAHAQQHLQHAAEEAARTAASAPPAATPPAPEPPAPAPDAHAAERQAALQRQVAALESKNETLLRTLSDLQAATDHQVGEALLARNTLECELLQLRQELELLRGQRLAPVFEPPAAPAPAAAPSADETLALQTLTWHRDRLLHRALALRQKRRQSRDAARALGSHFQDIARQREELRAKKENLELVKRFLERQEMVMARKLADHNALRTVAAVGIFLIMILGSSFAGIYTFLSPVYRTEAVIHTAPGNAEADIDGWLNRQADFIRSPEVTSAAWRILRSPDNHYAMHDVREEWLNSFAKHLTIAPDDAARTLTLRYSGPAAEGVSQVANALASAYVNPNLRDATEATHLIGAGATLDSPAVVPASPAQDHRFTTALAAAAAAVFLSLIAVMSFRHMVFRQLREIDAMADPNDLSDLSDEAALQPDA